MPQVSGDGQTARSYVGAYFLVCAGAFLSVATVRADTASTPSTEYRERIKVAQTAQPLGETPFGETVNLYKGGLSFNQTDIHFPGIGPTITFVRSYVLGGSTANPFGAYEMADWSLSIPRIKTIVPGDRASDVGEWRVDSSDGYARCSQFAKMSVYPYSSMGQNWWFGYQLATSDGGSQPLLRRTSENTLTPTLGGPYNVVTADHWMISCLTTTANGMPGEAFLATAPDGTRYWFNQLVYGPPIQTLTMEMGGSALAPSSGRPGTTDPSVNAGGTVAYLPRKMAYMYVTRIEDRFGNWINYNYSDGRPTSVTASDGRQANIQWRTDIPAVDSITLESGSSTPRTWKYEYANSSTAPVLSRVVLPDQSAWVFSMNLLDRREPIGNDDDYLSQCGVRTLPASDQPGIFAQITHPSGLVGAFEIAEVGMARANVPTVCYLQSGVEFEQVPTVYLTLSLRTKTFSGPGLPTQTWRYAYSPPVGSSQTECTANGCQDWSWVEVTDPTTAITRFSHSTRWSALEGTLLSVIDGVTAPGQTSPVGLRKQSGTYAAPTQGPFPARIGDALDNIGVTNDAPIEQLSPESLTTIEQQGVTFQRRVNSFDVYANPTSVTRSSSLGYSRSETTEYSNNTAKWVLGQVSKVTDTGTGKAMQQTIYDPNTALPLQDYRFGLLQQIRTYNADGTLATVKDGRNNLTTLSDWYRGLPRLITYANAMTQSATVSALGLPLTVTDELGYTTSYGYDALGRLNKITPPTGDSVAWNPTDRSFVPVASVEYGLPAGHWKQTVSTGNGRTTTYYDGRWQPVLTLTEDTGNTATKSFTVRRFDALGRETFTAYPVASLSTVDDTLLGVRTVYDALGRVIRREQDSELGVLTTTTEYLTGFQTRITDPRSQQTTTSYQAFDVPSLDAPVGLVAPEGISTVIARDGFGKALTVTRSGPSGQP